MNHRRATSEDIELLHGLYSHEPIAANMGFDPVSLSDFQQILEDLNQSGVLMIVEENGRNVGAYHLVRRKHRLSHIGYIGSLAIAPEYWGQGLGEKVVKAAIASLAAEGALRIELLVAADNARAIRLFERVGFVVEGRFKKYFRRSSTGEFYDELAMAMLLPTVSVGVGKRGSQTSHPVSTNNAEHYRWGNDCDGWHLVRRESLSVIQERMPAGTSETKHYHHLSQQFFFVLSGGLEIVVAESTHILSALQGIEISPGVAHQVRNNGPDEASFIVISQPPSHGDRVVLS